MNVFWYFFFFFISGFCGLVYEVLWLRLAMSKFGVTTPMVSVVLSVFMAGLALGSWGGGAITRRRKAASISQALRLYGVAELLIGLSSLLVPHLLQFGYELIQGGVSEPVWGSWSYYFLAAASVLVSLLPTCILMGATFPLAMAAIHSASTAYSGRSFSYFYLANVLGAIMGTLLPAFVLIELWGFQTTLYIASLLNIVLACTVFVLSFHRSSAKDSEMAGRMERGVPAVKLYDFPAGGSLWLLFITGFSTMAMEVVWVRQFTVYLGNVVYAFAVILAVYLAATWAGSFFYRHWARVHKLGESAEVWVYIGLLSLLPLLFTDPALPVSGEFRWAIFRTAAGIGPFSAALGFLTPLLVDHFSMGDPDRAGRAYAVNIIGGIVGPLLSGFCVLPLAGDRWALIALAVPLFAVGLVSVLHGPSEPASGVGRPARKLAYCAAVIAAAGLGLFTGDYKSSLTDRIELRDYMATVIAGSENGGKRLLVNGIGMTSLTPITKYMAHLPLAFLDHPARSGLVICFGMGTTFRSMLSWGIDTTVVELDPSIPQLFPYFHPNAPEIMKSSLAHIVIDDGRRYLERTSNLYDVITIDPPPPITTPTTSLLYSREFYQVVKRHLRPDGILQAWLAIRDPGWDLSTQTAFAKALRDSFPYIRVFPSLGGVGFHMLASDQPFATMTAEDLASHMPQSAASDFIEWGPADNAADMFRGILKTEQQIARIASIRPAIPAIQDDRPVNEYFWLRRLLGPYP